MSSCPSTTPAADPDDGPGTGALAARMLIDLLRAGQRVRFTARGSSMWPAVRDGAVVEVTPCPAGCLRTGDLGAYVSARDRLVVHRVVGATRTTVLFAGDTLAGGDPPVGLDRVLGRAAVVSQPPLHPAWPRAWHLRLLAHHGIAWLRDGLRRRD